MCLCVCVCVCVQAHTWAWVGGCMHPCVWMGIVVVRTIDITARPAERNKHKRKWMVVCACLCACLGAWYRHNTLANRKEKHKRKWMVVTDMLYFKIHRKEFVSNCQFIDALLIEKPITMVGTAYDRLTIGTTLSWGLPWWELYSTLFSFHWCPAKWTLIKSIKACFTCLGIRQSSINVVPLILEIVLLWISK